MKWFLYAAFFAVAVPAPAQIRPAFSNGRLLFVLGENPAIATPIGKTPDDLFQAIGAVKVTVLGSKIYSVSLPDGARIGRAFTTAQSFDFGIGARWSLEAVEEDRILLIVPAVLGATGPTNYQSISERCHKQSTPEKAQPRVK